MDISTIFCFIVPYDSQGISIRLLHEENEIKL